jgi:hypothetical protein
LSRLADPTSRVVSQDFPPAGATRIATDKLLRSWDKSNQQDIISGSRNAAAIRSLPTESRRHFGNIQTQSRQSPTTFESF